MNRPYTEKQVFELELCTKRMAHRLVMSGQGPWATLDESTLEAILYDAMIALREQMLDEVCLHGNPLKDIAFCLQCADEAENAYRAQGGQ